MSNRHSTPKQQTTTSRSAHHRAPKVTAAHAHDTKVQAVQHERTLDTLVHILDTYFARKAQARDERVIQW